MKTNQQTVYVGGKYEKYWDKAKADADNSDHLSLSTIVGRALKQYYESGDDIE